MSCFASRTDAYANTYEIEITASGGILDRRVRPAGTDKRFKFPISMGSFHALSKDQIDALIEDGAAAPVEKDVLKCTCPRDVLLNHGCKCGAMKAERERKKKEKGDVQD